MSGVGQIVEELGRRPGGSFRPKLMTVLDRRETVLAAALHVREDFLKPPFNTGVHIRFWIDWIGDNNGQMGRVAKLQGAGKS
jgi:hypothetical protein